MVTQDMPIGRHQFLPAFWARFHRTWPHATRVGLYQLDDRFRAVHRFRLSEACLPSCHER